MTCCGLEYIGQSTAPTCKSRHVLGAGFRWNSALFIFSQRFQLFEPLIFLHIRDFLQILAGDPLIIYLVQPHFKSERAYILLTESFERAFDRGMSHNLLLTCRMKQIESAQDESRFKRN